MSDKKLSFQHIHNQSSNKQEQNKILKEQYAPIPYTVIKKGVSTKSVVRCYLVMTDAPYGINPMIPTSVTLSDGTMMIKVKEHPDKEISNSTVGNKRRNTNEINQTKPITMNTQKL